MFGRLETQGGAVRLRRFALPWAMLLRPVGVFCTETQLSIQSPIPSTFRSLPTTLTLRVQFRDELKRDRCEPGWHDPRRALPSGENLGVQTLAKSLDMFKTTSPDCTSIPLFGRDAFFRDSYKKFTKLATCRFLGKSVLWQHGFRFVCWILFHQLPIFAQAQMSSMPAYFRFVFGLAFD